MQFLNNCSVLLTQYKVISLPLDGRNFKNIWVSQHTFIFKNMVDIIVWYPRSYKLKKCSAEKPSCKTGPTLKTTLETQRGKSSLIQNAWELYVEGCKQYRQISGSIKAQKWVLARLLFLFFFCLIFFFSSVAIKQLSSLNCTGQLILSF